MSPFTGVTKNGKVSMEIVSSQYLEHGESTFMLKEFLRVVKMGRLGGRPLEVMEALGGVEPPTCGLGNRRSIHLSYRADRGVRGLTAILAFRFGLSRAVTCLTIGAHANIREVR
jgi:hypothetical protein